MSSQTLSSASIAELTKRIQNRQAKVGIIGLGYVGLPLALLYTEQKFTVTGFDIDERKISTLRQGGSYIYRIEASEIKQAREQGFDATSDYGRIKEMTRSSSASLHRSMSITSPISATLPEPQHPSRRIFARDNWWCSRVRPTLAQQKKCWFRSLKKETSRT